MLNLKRRGHSNFFDLWAKLRAALAATSEYKAWRAEVVARASGLCQKKGCRKKGREAHHKIKVYKDPTKALDPDNGMLLCIPHHKQIHSKK